MCNSGTTFVYFINYFPLNKGLVLKVIVKFNDFVDLFFKNDEVGLNRLNQFPYNFKKRCSRNVYKK